jgi:hypothetical protein
MSSQTSDPDALRQEANRLYWESDESVNQIGEQLGLSKGILYGMLEALPAGLPCPACGEEMVFPNRTAREKGFLACPECGKEEEESAVQEYWETAAEADEEVDLPAPRRLARRAGGAVQKAVDTSRDRVAAMKPRDRILAGTALLGIAAGIMIGVYLNRRR